MPLDTGSLREFFLDQVQTVRRRQNVKLLDETEFYLVNLLAEFLDAAKLPEEPLALMYGRAVESGDPNERFRLMKHIGDGSLYVSGFFPDSFRHRLIDVGYYIGMGIAAYQFISSLSREPGFRPAFRAIFEELSEKFRRLVDLISEISESSGLASDSDLLRLYERWLETKSARLREKLRAQGIVPVDQATEFVH